MKIRNIVEVLSFFLGRFRLELRILKTLWNKHSFSKRKSVVKPIINVKQCAYNNYANTTVIPEDMQYLLNRANKYSLGKVGECDINRDCSPSERIKRSHKISEVVGAACSEISKFML